AQLVLEGCRPLPAESTLSKAAQQVVRPPRRDDALPEIGIRERPELAFLGDVIAIDVVPRPRCARNGRADRIVRAGDARSYTGEVPAQRDLDGRPAVSEHVIRRTHPWRDILPVRHAVHLRKISSGHKPTRI